MSQDTAQLIGGPLDGEVRAVELDGRDRRPPPFLEFPQLLGPLYIEWTATEMARRANAPADGAEYRILAYRRGGPRLPDGTLPYYLIPTRRSSTTEATP